MVAEKNGYSVRWSTGHIDKVMEVGSDKCSIRYRRIKWTVEEMVACVGKWREEGGVKSNKE